MSGYHDRESTRKPRGFTSNKLDLMNAVAFDQRIDPYAARVFSAIIYCLNADNGRCFPSDDLIMDLVGGSRPAIWRARIKLRRCGYLDWRKTSRSNHFFFNPAAAAPTLTAVKRKIERRKERREMLQRETREAYSEKPLCHAAF